MTGIKLRRKKKRLPLISALYRLFTKMPGSDMSKFRFFLNMEWLFDRLSHEYSFKYYTFENHPIRQNTIAFLRKVISPGQRVLDLGCHCGDLSFLVSKIADHVTGVDYNEDWIRTARARHQAANIDFVHGEAEAFLEKETSTYDVLVLSHILEHLDDPASFIAKFKSHFNYFYIEVPDFEKTHLNEYRRDLDMPLIYMDADHISEFDRDDLENLVEANGMRIIRAEYKNGVQRLWCSTNL